MFHLVTNDIEPCSAKSKGTSDLSSSFFFFFGHATWLLGS